MTSTASIFAIPVDWLGGILPTAVDPPRVGTFLARLHGLRSTAKAACKAYPAVILPAMRPPHVARTLRAVSASAIVLMASGSGAWSKEKPTRFWNLTGDTVMHLSIAPAGSDAYGPDQCRNDRDGTVDYDERLPVTGIGSGRYDLVIDLKKGRQCRVGNVEILQGEVFTVEEKDLGDCKPSPAR